MNFRSWCLAGPALLWSALAMAADTDSNIVRVSMEEIAPQRRELARVIMESPTLQARGPAESFYCQPEHYYWFLDHPDRAVTAWRRLGARCVSITPRGPNTFGWTDENGSEVLWETVHRGPNKRIWLAEGKVKPGLLLPTVPVKVLVVLNHSESQTADGAKLLAHRADIYVQTDSKSASLITKMLGNSANKMAEQGLGQLQLFFSGLSWYLDRHPERMEALLKE